MNPVCAMVLPSRLIEPPAPSSPRLTQYEPAVATVRSPVQVHVEPAGRAWPLAVVLSSCGTTAVVLVAVVGAQQARLAVMGQCGGRHRGTGHVVTDGVAQMGARVVAGHLLEYLVGAGLPGDDAAGVLASLADRDGLSGPGADERQAALIDGRQRQRAVVV